MHAWPTRYTSLMIDVLVYVYENYWRPDACPEPDQLHRKLISMGFEDDEVREALEWLDGLSHLAARPHASQSAAGVRVYSRDEIEHLGPQSLGFVAFLESAGVLPPDVREIVLECAQALPGGPVSLESLKIAVLMVFWSLGQEPDTLILDELFVDPEERTLH